MSGFATSLLVAAGGATGAVLRHWTGVLSSTLGLSWPVGTFLVNIIGSFVIGFVAHHLGGHNTAHPLLITGLLGGFTTYSAFALDAVRLAEAGRWGTALAYILGTLVICVAGAAAGIAVGRATE